MLLLVPSMSGGTDQQAAGGPQEGGRALALGPVPHPPPSAIPAAASPLLPADIFALFEHYNGTYFEGQLGACSVEWSSKRMTLCGGVCHYEPRGGCRIKLSEPLLKLRPGRDLKAVLLHEMIHARVMLMHGGDDDPGEGGRPLAWLACSWLPPWPAPGLRPWQLAAGCCFGQRRRHASSVSRPASTGFNAGPCAVTSVPVATRHAPPLGLRRWARHALQGAHAGNQCLDCA